MGGIIRGLCLPRQRIDSYKAEGLISGWVGKIRNNNNFRINRQSNYKVL